jgi:hypothetical protein
MVSIDVMSRHRHMERRKKKKGKSDHRMHGSDWKIKGWMG